MSGLLITITTPGCGLVTPASIVTPALIVTPAWKLGRRENMQNGSYLKPGDVIIQIILESVKFGLKQSGSPDDLTSTQSCRVFWSGDWRLVDFIIVPL